MEIRCHPDEYHCCYNLSRFLIFCQFYLWLNMYFFHYCRPFFWNIHIVHWPCECSTCGLFDQNFNSAIFFRNLSWSCLKLKRSSLFLCRPISLPEIKLIEASSLHHITALYLRGNPTLHISVASHYIKVLTWSLCICNSYTSGLKPKHMAVICCKNQRLLWQVKKEFSILWLTVVSCLLVITLCTSSLDMLVVYFC